MTRDARTPQQLEGQGLGYPGPLRYPIIPSYVSRIVLARSVKMSGSEEKDFPASETEETDIEAQALHEP